MSLQDAIGSLHMAIDHLKDMIENIKSDMVEYSQIHDVERRLGRIEIKLNQLIEAREDA